MRPPDGGSNPGHADPFLLYFHAHAFDPLYRCPSIDQEGRTITRDAATPVELAAACQAALDTKAKKEQELDAELKAVAAEKAKLGEAHGQLSPMLARIRTAVEQLAGLRPQELAEISEFVREPELSSAAKEAVQQAREGVERAHAALRALDEAALDEARQTEAPPPALRASVEAVCVLLDTKPDFFAAQNRLMRSTRGLTRRLLHFDRDMIPRSAANRLRKFAEAGAGAEGGGGEGGGSSAEGGLAAVAAALRGWVEAMLQQEQAEDEAKMGMEQVTCTAAMQGACECVCDLLGLDGLEEDMRGALLLAQVLLMHDCPPAAPPPHATSVAPVRLYARLSSAHLLPPRPFPRRARRRRRGAPRPPRSSRSRGCSRRCTGCANSSGCCRRTCTAPRRSRGPSAMRSARRRSR